MAENRSDKGVISGILQRRICHSKEDEEFETLQVILNPLGVPSRMNIGQVLRFT